MGRPTFFDYSREPRHDTVLQHVKVPLRNGLSLAGDLTLPAEDGRPAAGPFPGLIAHYTPYGRAARRAEASWWAARGYAVLVCDIRGTGDSPGMFPGCLSAGENEDNYDAIEWLATQAFCTGHIGQYGQSYGGMTALRVASLKPPHLVAIAPQEAYSSYYRHTAFPGGVPAGAGRNWADLVPALTGGRVSATFQRELWSVHPLLDELWEQIDIDTKYGTIEVPTLLCGGWFDNFREGMVENHLGLGQRSYLVMGPWNHGPLDAMANEPLPLGALLGFFDHHLTGGGWDEGAGAPLPRARVTSYELPREASHGWSELDGFPPANALTRVLACNAGGHLGDEPGPPAIERYLVDPNDGPSVLVFPPAPDFPDTKAADRQGPDRKRLGFATPPLLTDLVLFGIPRLFLQAATTASDAVLVARLMDYAPDGSASEITVGYLLASHREGHAKLVPVRPGELVSYEIALQPVHWRVRAGHRLRVSLSSGDMPALLPVAPEGTISVACGRGGTFLQLPCLPSDE
jgi:predicted acyl esterase